ncbi:MAG: acetate kinase [Bacillota bacterium]
MKILVINSGSSSLKYKLFAMKKEEVLAEGIVERIGVKNGSAIVTHIKTGEGKYQEEKNIPSHHEALNIVVQILIDTKWGVLSNLSEINGVGHRVVHGGEYFKESTVINGEVLSRIEELRDLGPLHMPPNIMGIYACMKLMPKTPQIAVFDTAFHQTMPKKAYLYALPYDFYENQKVRRYGFHGTSHRFVSQRAAEFLNRPFEELKMLTLHLGNGSSIAAIDHGKVVETSMGLTPLEGLVMGTRSGDIDPAIFPLICQTLNMTPHEADEFLNKKSGFLGMTGFSDMRDIKRERAEGNIRAEEAFQVFLHRLVKYVGAYYAVLKGFDCMVFTAGIGENDWEVREDLCRELEFMGILIDYKKNHGLRGKVEVDLSLPESKVRVLVLPTNEELLIARDTYQLLKG